MNPYMRSPQRNRPQSREKVLNIRSLIIPFSLSNPHHISHKNFHSKTRLILLSMSNSLRGNFMPDTFPQQKKSWKSFFGNIIIILALESIKSIPLLSHVRCKRKHLSLRMQIFYHHPSNPLIANQRFSIYQQSHIQSLFSNVC